MKFDCEGCGRAMSVPDHYAGKRVRCPGCQAAQRVPMPESTSTPGEMSLASQPMADLSGLDDNQASGVRRLRQVLIGCGSCQKTIKIPESKLGKTMPCTSCGVVLKVDAFNLSKAKGDLIDMTHLELDKADLLLDGGAHGSTLGGSSIQLDGSGSMGGTGGTGGYELNMPPAGSMSGVSVNNSQSQMRELRELNDLKHSGQISSEEYRERKKEIYGGKTLAIQAMSRSADGSGNRPVIKRDDKPPLLPKPVMILIVIAILGGGGFAAWSSLKGGSSSTTNVATNPTPPQPSDDTAKASTDTTTEDQAVVDAASGEEAIADTGDVPDGTEGEAGDGTPLMGTAELPVTMFEIDESLGTIGVPTSTEPGEPEIEMTITGWSTEWPTYTVDRNDNRAIGKACQLLQRVTVRDNRALIGVAVGPAAADLDSPAYRRFRQEMQDILTDVAEADGVLDNLNLRTSERTAQLGSLESHRLHITSKSDRSVRATILTGIQDGYCITYWFAGAKTLYDEFLDTVGKAEFGPAK